LTVRDAILQIAACAAAKRQLRIKIDEANRQREIDETNRQVQIKIDEAKRQREIDEAQRQIELEEQRLALTEFDARAGLRHNLMTLHLHLHHRRLEKIKQPQRQKEERQVQSGAIENFKGNSN
jgi:hypothetical protein